MPSEQHSSRQGPSSQVQSACASRSTRCRPGCWRDSGEDRVRTTPRRSARTSPTVLWDALTWLTATLAKLRPATDEGEKPPPLQRSESKGHPPFAPFVQECSLATTISRGGLFGTNARGNRYERTVYRHQLTWK